MTGQTTTLPSIPWRKNTVFLLFLALSLGILASCQGKKTAETAKLSDTQTEWPKKTYDFGDLTEGEIVSHAFYFKNTVVHPHPLSTLRITKLSFPVFLK